MTSQNVAHHGSWYREFETRNAQICSFPGHEHPAGRSCVILMTSTEVRKRSVIAV